MEFEEEMGESASPPDDPSLSPRAIARDICNRLVEDDSKQGIRNYRLREELKSHFYRLPDRYALDMKNKPQDVLLHKKILVEARDPEKRPAFRCRFMKYIQAETGVSINLQPMEISSISTEFRFTSHEEDQPSNIRDGSGIDSEASSMLKELHLERKKNVRDNEEINYITEASSKRKDLKGVPVHEITFADVDKPTLLSQLSALLSGIGLNIREVHAFPTTAGYSLIIFTVDGWKNEETDRLAEAVDQAIATSQWKISFSYQRELEMVRVFQEMCDEEIDRSFLKFGEEIASGFHGTVYHGLYLGVDVTVKVFKHDRDGSFRAPFNREVNIMRQVEHSNVVRFIGANGEPPYMCIVTEYISRGSLFDYLHKRNNVLEFHSLLKYAIDVCKGMDHLHQRNIIHRDLKTANLLMGANDVVKVADFGLARFQTPDGQMTGGTGTYGWMAPEVMDHKPYDHKADVFSFGILLWELATSKIPYRNLSPLQAAMGVRKVVTSRAHLFPRVTICRLIISSMKTSWQRLD